jgi:hypothetical protein
MIVVLAISLLFVDALYLINANRETITEGFTRSVTFKDPSGLDISANEFIERAMKHMTPKPTKSTKEDVSDDESSDDETTPGNNLKEVDEQSKKMKNVIEKVKSVSPEVMDSLSMLNGIDITELNKLINNMNNIAKTLTK